MTARNQAILGFTVGYLGAALLLMLAAYLVLMPFGYGYIGAELAAAYYAWCTIQQWDAVNDRLTNMLEQYGL